MPKVLILQMCHSELFAETFIELGCNYVICFDKTQQLWDEAGREFVKIFLDQLFQGSTIR